jgi:putative ABC transport system substrate-binding protein
LLVAGLLLLAGSAPAGAEESVLRIAVVLSRDVPPYREALKGYEEVLKASGRTYKLHEFSADGVAAQRGTLARKIRARQPDLILTVGSSATDIVSAGIDDLPIVFSMVLSSTGDRTLERLQLERPNLTGGSMEIPVETQFARLKEILPAARRIGVLYDPDNSGPLIDQASRAARELGLQLVPLPVSNDSDVLGRTEALSAKVDVLWSVADSTVFSHHGLKHILLETLRHRVPFVGLSPSFVKAGALLAFSTDYRDLGRQAGEQSLRILEGESTVQVPMTAPRSLSVSINMNTAKQIRVDIDDEVRSDAHVYF